MKFKYAFYCSGKASRLINFYNQNSLDEFNFEFVYYDGDSKQVEDSLIALFGTERLIKPTYEIDKNISNKKLSQHISNELLMYLKKFSIEYLFCFGDKILKPNLVVEYTNRIINFHPSLLPSFPGLNSIDQALLSNVQFLGNTAHFIDFGVDSGPIILQSVYKRRYFKQYDDLLNLQIPMLKLIWELLEGNKIKVVGNAVEISDYDSNKIDNKEKYFFSI